MTDPEDPLAIDADGATRERDRICRDGEDTTFHEGLAAGIQHRKIDALVVEETANETFHVVALLPRAPDGINVALGEVLAEGPTEIDHGCIVQDRVVDDLGVVEREMSWELLHPSTEFPMHDRHLG